MLWGGLSNQWNGVACAALFFSARRISTAGERVHEKYRWARSPTVILAPFLRDCRKDDGGHGRFQSDVPKFCRPAIVTIKHQLAGGTGSSPSRGSAEARAGFQRRMPLADGPPFFASCAAATLVSTATRSYSAGLPGEPAFKLITASPCAGGWNGMGQRRRP